MDVPGTGASIRALSAPTDPPRLARVVAVTAAGTSGGVLLVSSNGAGMGHLTRLLAIGRRLDDDVPRTFFSLSSAVPAMAAAGAGWEYCPSAGALGGSGAAWNDMFAERFRLVLGTYRPSVVVFDGTWPYSGLVRVRREVPATRFVWSRRAMWKPSVTGDHLGLARAFDLVVEPGEYAGAVDVGATTRATDAVRVAPVTLVDPEDLLPREVARRELGLPEQGRALLLTLGAGNINDISSDVGAVVGAVRDRHPGWTVWLTRPPISETGPPPEGVSTLQVYPLARYLRAFDGAVAAAGYNAFHELLAAGVPTVWVPNLGTTTDDQLARARFAQDAGVGWCVPDVPAGIDDALAGLVDDDRRATMAAEAVRTYPGNGAGPAAALVGGLLP